MATYIVISLKNLYNDVISELEDLKRKYEDLQNKLVRQTQEYEYETSQLRNKLEPKRPSKVQLISHLHGLQILYAHVPRDRKIRTIKILRDYLSCTLLEARDIVEKVIEENENGLRGILYCGSWEDMKPLMALLEAEIEGIRLQVEVL